MWYDREVASLSAEIDRLTGLRDQHGPRDRTTGATWDRFDSQIAELVARRDAMQSSIPALAAATDEIASTDNALRITRQRLEHHEHTSRRLGRDAVIVGLLAVALNVSVLPSMWLFAAIVAFVVIAVGVSIRRVCQRCELEDIAFTAELDNIEAQASLHRMLAAIEDGRPVPD